MLEVQRQLSQTKLTKAVSETLQHSKELPTPQRHLIECLLTLPPPTLDQEMSWRTEAINAIASYCQFEEGDTYRLPRNKRPENVMVEIECLDDQPSEIKTKAFTINMCLPIIIRLIT